MRLFFLGLFGAIRSIAVGQQTLVIQTRASENQTPLSATILIKGTIKGYSTDSLGTVSVLFSANGSYTLLVSATGYEEKEVRIIVPHSPDTLEIPMQRIEHQLDEVVIQSTRTSRTIANVPTRVETIELEEIDEKSNMRPANVAMLLHESTGIQVQQTSATSGNASIRIQGLDGRYTQLLKDGFANFGNFSSGLSVLEIPPLDLRQVEIIKGPASPLYGGGAIAGVVNFISKTPKAKPEYSFILNQSNIGQSNIGGFAAQRGKKLGYTLLALYNRSNACDVDRDDFTEVPKTNEVSIHPKLFFYPNENTVVIFGNSFTAGARTGGDMQVVEGKADAAHRFFEKNKTLRNITTFELDKNLGNQRRFVVKQSFSVFNRGINIPDYRFAGIDDNAFTDISYVTSGKAHSFVLGGNFIYNRFAEKEATNSRDSRTTTGGVYAQHTWDATDKIKLESGLRADAVSYKNRLYSNTEFFVLPRISLLVKYGPKWSSRIGAGMGYKAPTLFTEQTETIQYRGLAQLANVVSEKSYGGTADLNFRTAIGTGLSLAFNQMFFYTWINQPLVLQMQAPDRYRFVNAASPVQSAGFETNARLIYKERLKLFLGYTFTSASAGYLPGSGFLPLVPKSKLNSALIYENEGAIKVGVEGYFTGSQYLSNGTKTPSFAEIGLMAEKGFRRFSLFMNLENFTDTRQSRFKRVVNGSHLAPGFDEIWTHTEGFVLNGGIKIKL